MKLEDYPMPEKKPGESSEQHLGRWHDEWMENGASWFDRIKEKGISVWISIFMVIFVVLPILSLIGC